MWRGYCPYTTSTFSACLDIMNQIVNLAKLEREEADKEVIEIEAKCRSALERQRKGQKADELMGPLNRT
jgi:hypothetical protein